MIYYEYGTRSSNWKLIINSLQPNLMRYSDDRLGIYRQIFYCNPELSKEQILNNNLEFIGVESNGTTNRNN